MRTPHLAKTRGGLARLLHRGLAFALGAVACAALHATPPLDPICGSPSSQEFVRAIRAQRMAAAQARRAAVRLQGPEVPPRLWIQRPEPWLTPRLWF